ncbi:MAG TPA: ice-binding family protein [Candidatus Saccharimonadales bacterium]
MVNQIVIQWNASPPPVSGYNVRRGTAPGNEGAVPLNAVPIVGTTYTDNAVYPGVSYSYEVTAVYNGVESAESLGIFTSPVPFNLSPESLDGYLDGAASFGVLAATTVTNVPGTATMVSGDVGVSPGTSITGFVAPAAISGVFHAGDFVAAGAQGTVLSAFTHGNALPGTTIPADIGGLTFGPGVYNVASSLDITGALVLDGGGNPNAVWIFQVGSTLTTASTNSDVVLTGGAQAHNVFWLVGSSATLNTSTSFKGSLLAYASITVSANVSIEGRLFAMNGAVTLDNDNIVIFFNGLLAVYASSTAFGLGDIVFDCATGTYQQVTSSGISGATPPTFLVPFGSVTQDGSITWMSLDPPTVTVSVNLPPSPPNVPPPPPAAPTNLMVVSES